MFSTGYNNYDLMQYKRLTLGDLDDLESILTQSLNSSPMSTRIWTKILKSENIRILKYAKSVIGGLGFIETDQWYGAKAVPAAVITAMGVLIDQWGEGIETAILKDIMSELHEQGIPLCVANPRVMTLYRKFGFEKGGVRNTYELNSSDIHIRERMLRVEPVPDSAADIDDFKVLYEQRAKLSSGHLKRTAPMWQNILFPKGHNVSRFFILKGKRKEGYFIFSPGEQKDIMQINDMCLLSRSAARRLLTFFIDHRSISKKIIWQGGSYDPLDHSLPEKRTRLIESNEWLIRIIDVEKALLLRGYPPGINATIHFDITDDTIRSNSDRFILNIANGIPSVERGGDGMIRLGIRELAALYTGFLSPSELVTFADLSGFENDLLVTGAAFSGPSPWMPDTI